MLAGLKMQIINSVYIIEFVDLNCSFQYVVVDCSISVNVLNVEHRLVYRLSKTGLDVLYIINLISVCYCSFLNELMAMAQTPTTLSVVTLFE